MANTESKNELGTRLKLTSFRIGVYSGGKYKSKQQFA